MATPWYHFLLQSNAISEAIMYSGGCVDTAMECTLSRYQRLLSQFITTSKGVQVFAYTTIMETVLSKVSMSLVSVLCHL